MTGKFFPNKEDRWIYRFDCATPQHIPPGRPTGKGSFQLQNDSGFQISRLRKTHYFWDFWVQSDPGMILWASVEN